jgi:hypothetical protein
MIQRKHLVVLLLSVTLWALPSVLQAQTSFAERMAAANELYEEERYVEATLIYEELAAQGVRDGALFYNLGNAYFKRQMIGHAILNYRRAEQYAPRDPDVQANLSIARQQTIDKLDPGNEVFIVQVGHWAIAWLNLDEMALAVLGLWGVLVLLLLARMRMRRGRLRDRTLSAIFVVLFFLLGGVLSLGTRLFVEATRPAGVIVAEEAPVVSGPGPQYTTEFTLHNGAEVSLLETRGNWTRLSLPGDELQGWVTASSVERVTLSP